MALRRYKSANAMNPKRIYRKPYVVTISILDHENGHYVTAKHGILKYSNFKKDVDPNAHVKVFNFTIKANAETFEEYNINAFSYTFKDTASNWCDNYMSKKFVCIFSKLTNAFYKHH
jgi:hypothetical protein